MVRGWQVGVVKNCSHGGIKYGIESLNGGNLAMNGLIAVGEVD